MIRLAVLVSIAVGHTLYSTMSRRLGRVALLVTVALFLQATGSAAPSAFAERNSQTPINGTFVTGFVYYDLNGNGQWDPGEPKAPNAPMQWAVLTPGAKGSPAATDSSGNFTINLSPQSIDASPTTPYRVVAQGVNTVGSKLGVPYVIADGDASFYVPPDHIATVDIALHIAGSTNQPTHFPMEAVFISYFDHRGGVPTFGYPISRLFLFQGLPTQIFQRAVLQQWPDGSVHLLNLLDPGFMPFTSFNGAIVPAYDSSFVAHLPPPGSPGYINQVMQVIAQNVPNSFSGQPVGFDRTFVNTVTAESAFPALPTICHAPGSPPPAACAAPPPEVCQRLGLPQSSCVPPPGYGDLSLLPGFDLEIWGVPTSAPMVDPHNNSFIYQRFQRGIMMYQANQGVTEGLLLGQYFKEILTGQALPPDVAQEAAGSPYLDQYCPTGPHWICRPDQLDPSTTDLTGAFEPEAPAQ